ncbi:nlpc/p60 superfamily protein [Pteropox virus]|uniref:Protein OPG091 n=1 Tax=Pteropox virus TaxID=1873698 RepID=A0A1B1MRJ2_9POXV|nr:nlpc/p60 superfamily protein [Pteropox virus]ANS71145.1 nlpc/p60 superfamily protein [Pteropox virus]
MTTASYEFIKAYVPRGAIIFVNSWHSLTEQFNPSNDKHAAIYFGDKLCTHLLKTRCVSYDNICDSTLYAIESTAVKGAHIIPLKTLITKSDIKIYILDNFDSPYKIMEQAADNALELVGAPYGFNSNNLYCFKMVANCFEAAGVDVSTYRLLGKDIYLSQSFTNDPKWKKIYSSESNNMCSIV